MKKLLVLVLLLSLGLNLGLGVRMLRENHNDGRKSGDSGYAGKFRSKHHGGTGGHLGDGDGTFWRGVMERRLNHVAEQLGLNSEQAEAFKKAHKEAAEIFLAQRIKVTGARVQLMAAASEPNFDSTSLRSLIAEVGRQQAKLDSMVTETMLAEMEILNAEQRHLYMKILPINRMDGRRGGPRHQSGGWKR